MKHILNLLAVLAIACAGVIVASAQENEIAVMVGGVKTGDKGLQSSSTIKAAFDGATAYELNYAHRMVDGKVASLHWELMIAGIPKTGVKSTNLILPRSYSSLFLVPGLKVKLFPGGVSPFVVAGLGVGRLTASDNNLNGQPNTGDKADTTWIFNYGGGVDFPIFPHVALRGEVRDLIAGTPNLNGQLFEKRQHNVLVAGGVVIRW
ncbi:MAG: outer membrane beta-barrel protein [Blastocatellia bacterium]|nr:outer membrane beta-barrel protein [Acidobacteriota bacterium]